MKSILNYLIPEQASTVAVSIDALFYTLLVLTVILTLGLIALLIFFAVRYRVQPGNELAKRVEPSLKIEATWSLIPLIIMLAIFFWSAHVYMRMAVPPSNSMNLFVVGKQWMWKIEHPSGRMEINEMHVPVGQPVRLTMISQDVIHSFFVPAFRVKQDVLPGRYSTLWFQATQPGTYHLFCTQYCGTQHAAMVGDVIAMSAADYVNWEHGSTSNMSPEAAGRKLFETLTCVTCHRNDSLARGPQLDGLWNKKVLLEGGKTVVATEDYIRESILDPSAKIVKGFSNIMPSFRGRVSEDELMQLIAYIRSLGVAK